MYDSLTLFHDPSKNGAAPPYPGGVWGGGPEPPSNQAGGLAKALLKGFEKFEDRQKCIVRLRASWPNQAQRLRGVVYLNGCTHWGRPLAFFAGFCRFLQQKYSVRGPRGRSIWMAGPVPRLRWGPRRAPMIILSSKGSPAGGGGGGTRSMSIISTRYSSSKGNPGPPPAPSFKDVHHRQPHDFRPMHVRNRHQVI